MNFATNLAPEQLREQANSLLDRDRARLLGQSRPQYQGPMAANMSALTQRAHTLQDQYRSRPAPYQQRISNVLQRPNTGLDVNALVNPIEEGERNLFQNRVIPEVNRQLGDYARPLQPHLAQRAETERGNVMNRSRARFGDLNNVVTNLENHRNQGIAETFRGLGNNTQERRRLQLSGLTAMGNQRQAHGNMEIGGQRAAFEEQANAPYRNMDRLQAILGQHGNGFTDSEHPDLQRPMSRELMAALNAYGINTSLPVSQWDSSRLPDQNTFTGRRTAPLTPEILASHNMMERVSARPEGEISDQRRRLVESMSAPESLASRAAPNIMASANPQIAAQEAEFQRALQSRIGDINSRYINLGQFGSHQNRGAIAEAVAEMMRRSGEGRAETIEQSTRNRLNNEHQNELSNLSRVNTLGNEEQAGYRNMLGNIEGLNRRGAENWNNNQRDLEDIYQNFQSSSPWNFSPQIRAGLIGHGREAGFSAGQNAARSEMGNPNYINNMNLDNPMLAQMGERYNALQRDAQQGADASRIANDEQRRQAEAQSLRQAQDQFAQQEQQRQAQLQQEQQQERERQAAQRSREMSAWDVRSHPLARAEYDQQQYRNSNHAMYDPGGNLTHNVYGRTQNIAAIQDLRNRGWNDHPFYVQNHQEYDPNLPRNIEAVRRSHNLNYGIDPNRNDPMYSYTGWGRDRMVERPANPQGQNLGQFLGLPGYS